MDAIPTFCKITREAQETLVKAHAILVKRIARHMIAKLPNTVLIDDLIQAGMMGLLEAARNYDAEKGASFETYAGIRIRGHILDEVRQNDWLPRSVHKNARTIATAVRKIENRLGRGAKDREIAKELNLELHEYYDFLKEAAEPPCLGFQDFGMSDDDVASHLPHGFEPHSEVIRRDLKTKLAKVIDTLPERERMILSLYYEQDLNLKEIGAVFDIGESRVSQIMTQAIVRIQSRLNKSVF